MDQSVLYAMIAGFSLLGIASILLSRRSGRLITGGRGRLPRRLELRDVATGDIPEDAKKPLEFLAGRLVALGFETADLPARVPALQTFSHRLLLVPFVHVEEQSFFVMGIEAGLHPRTQLMLHIITPLTDGRRVETSTLAPLDGLKRPDKVEARVVLDADTVEEIWSRHRRALFAYQRAERLSVKAEDWRAYAAQAYEGWVQSAVRAQRLQLEANGEMYRVRSRPKSVI